MSDSRGQSSEQSSGASPTDGSRPGAWQQVLAQLGARPGSYSAEQLAELARRAGVSDPSQLASLGRALGVGQGAATGGVPQHLLFTVGEVVCALPAEAVQGVERILDVTPVPNTASWVLGVVQVWGTIVSVVDMQALLGLPPQQVTSRSRLLVVTTGDMSVGFLVPAIVEMHALGDNVAGRVDARAAPEWVRPYALGALQDGSRTVVVLDPKRLLSNDKLHRYQGG